jgi:hypothetical protein
MAKAIQIAVTGGYKAPDVLYVLFDDGHVERAVEQPSGFVGKPSTWEWEEVMPER